MTWGYVCSPKTNNVDFYPVFLSGTKQRNKQIPQKGAGTMISKENFQKAIATTVVRHIGFEISMAEKFACMTMGLIEFGSVKITRLA
jgi:hypothetical protein